MPRSNRRTYATALAFSLLLWAGASISGTAPVCAQAGCATANFAPAANFAVGSAPISVAAGDFNGDGNTDLVTANLNSNNVSILLGNGAGGFTGPVNFPAGLGPNSVGVADFNGDGKLDLAVANQIVGSGTVSILTGAGDGTFSAPSGFTAGSFPLDLAVGDFNGDGKSDVAIPNSETNEIRVLPGTGTGSLGAPIVTAAAASGFSGVFRLEVGDFNGDGKSDLVGLREKDPQPPFGPGAISIFLGTGAGIFTTGEIRPAGINPAFVAVASLGGDAFSDLVVTNRASATVSILRGAGDGSFPATQTITTGGIPESVTVADFNLDGRNDLAVARQAGGSGSVVGVYLGDGAGGFNPSGNFAIGTVPFGSLVADFNKDGKPDIATANYTSHNVSVLINGCGASAAQVSVQFQQSSYVTDEAQTVVS
ncbi:MAG TPA: VCBS repeat-containing protein, partial [Pyrinomonadaceae bacterium]